ncbi:uncharacterized protein LOC122093028 [Macadamia integrifolia]|uniref:uncharacterized protein LOC122093028 n=1 Tax=Macadamia integrifolia TaxID=60698 RepID=UPI001C529FB4|nr:uncharacterized protein LOC122093028 [Macadamia integrifolia]
MRQEMFSSLTLVSILTCFDKLDKNRLRKQLFRGNQPPNVQSLHSVIRKLDPFDHLKGTSALDQAKDSRVATQATIQWREMGNDEKMMVVQAEMKRVDKLPISSSYATHRKRVLNKVLQLMSIQRSNAQEEELDLLFAGLSL